MTTGSDFIRRFDDVVAERAWRTRASPSELIRNWSDFVVACRDGYSSTIYEYENERGVRDLLEHALSDPMLQTMPEFGAFRDAIQVIDARFEGQCREDVSMAGKDAPWWHRCVPRGAEGDLADDLRDLYGIASG